MKLDLTTIILTYNEELHIRRCLENVCPFSKKVYVIDSPSTDRTAEIVQEVNASFSSQLSASDSPLIEVVVHKYPGNQAEQFNWAIDNLPIDTEWILRIDADEYLLQELVEEMERKLPTMDEEVTGVELKRRHIFMGKWVKHGIYPVLIMRLFRNGCARYDNRLMDEHITLSKGRSVVFENDFCDHSLISIDEYCKKHLNYARREAVEILADSLELRGESSGVSDKGLGAQAEEKHKKKGTYNKLPLFFRSFIYFCFRYILKGGFLDGIPGFVFAFVQGWWYRTMVDVNVYNAKKCLEQKGYSLENLNEEGKEVLKEYIKKEWNISL